MNVNANNDVITKEAEEEKCYKSMGVPIAWWLCTKHENADAKQTIHYQNPDAIIDEEKENVAEKWQRTYVSNMH